jgi:hypothetical protein
MKMRLVGVTAAALLAGVTSSSTEADITVAGPTFGGLVEACNEDIYVDGVTVVEHPVTGSRSLTIRAINGSIFVYSSLDPRIAGIDGRGENGANGVPQATPCSVPGTAATAAKNGFAITLETVVSGACNDVPPRPRNISVGSSITVDGGNGGNAAVGHDEALLSTGDPCCPQGACCVFGATSAKAATPGANAGSITIKAAGDVGFGPVGSLSACGGRGVRHPRMVRDRPSPVRTGALADKSPFSKTRHLRMPRCFSQQAPSSYPPRPIRYLEPRASLRTGVMVVTAQTQFPAVIRPAWQPLQAMAVWVVGSA